MTYIFDRFTTPSLVTACVLLAGPAWADSTLTFQKGGQQSMQVAVAGNHVRIDMSNDDEDDETGPQYMIYDASKPAFTFVFPNDRAYRHMEGASLKAMQAMGNQGGGLQQQMLKAGWGADDKTPAGITCRWAQLSYGAMTLAALCLADEDELNLDGEEAAAVRAAMSFGKNTLGDLSQYGLEGFPVMMKDDEGTTTALTAISHTDIPSASFTVPAGFEKLDDAF